jgi:hypothetical protein
MRTSQKQCAFYVFSRSSPSGFCKNLHPTVRQLADCFFTKNDKKICHYCVICEVFHLYLLFPVKIEISIDDSTPKSLFYLKQPKAH